MEVRLLGPLEVAGKGLGVEARRQEARRRPCATRARGGARGLTRRARRSAVGWAAPKTAANTVQVYVSALRKALKPVAEGGEPIVRDGAVGYRLALAPASFDHVRFASRRGRSAISSVTDRTRARSVHVSGRSRSGEALHSPTSSMNPGRRREAAPPR